MEPSNTANPSWTSEDNTVSVQNLSDDDDVPEPASFNAWVVNARNATHRARDEVTVRLVADAEMRSLNKRYRDADKVTNVLSFPFEAPPGLADGDHDELAILGDIVISPALVKREAEEQFKEPTAHFAHLTIHGVLHLSGLDHESDVDAKRMEAMESRLMTELGFSDPWQSDRLDERRMVL